jgi:hypothetical protein
MEKNIEKPETHMSVTARSSRLLIEPFEALGHIVMYDIANVRLIDSLAP